MLIEPGGAVKKIAGNDRFVKENTQRVARRPRGRWVGQEQDAQVMTHLSHCRPSVGLYPTPILPGVSRSESLCALGAPTAMPLVPAVDSWVYRRGWSRRKTICVGRTKRSAMTRRTMTMVMYIRAMASTE